jgi:hypothetical protein
MLIEYHPSHLN